MAADTLSRTPIRNTSEAQDLSFEKECQAYVNAVMKELPVTEKGLLELKQAHLDDVTCQRVNNYVIR